MQRVYGTAFLSEKELQEHLHRLEEAKKRDHRKIGRDQKLFMFHQWAPGATFWLAKGTTLYNTLAELHARRALPGRLRRGEGADRLQQGALGDVRPLAALPPEHVPRRRRRRASRWALKAMNCPGHMLDLRAARCAATATCRSASRADAAAPQRSVRRALGPDARPAVQPGRCALLRDGVADRRGSRAAAAAGAARLRRLRPDATR